MFDSMHSVSLSSHSDIVHVDMVQGRIQVVRCSADYIFPKKHETLNHCCFNVGPASQTVVQHLKNSGSTSRVFRLAGQSVLLVIYRVPYLDT